jgi:hypothetical protein
VYGRPLTRREMLRLLHAEQTVQAVRLIRDIGPEALEQKSPYLFRLAHKALKLCQT